MRLVMALSKQNVEKMVEVVMPSEWRSCRGRQVAWTIKHVNTVAEQWLHDLPPAVLHLIQSGHYGVEL